MSDGPSDEIAVATQAQHSKLCAESKTRGLEPGMTFEDPRRPNHCVSRAHRAQTAVAGPARSITPCPRRIPDQRPSSDTYFVAAATGGDHNRSRQDGPRPGDIQCLLLGLTHGQGSSFLGRLSAPGPHFAMSWQVLDNVGARGCISSGARVEQLLRTALVI